MVQLRQCPTPTDKPRRSARSRDSANPLTRGGHALAAQMPRTLRTLQRYCASGRLDGPENRNANRGRLHRLQSVQRANGELKMIYADRPAATSRDVSAPVAPEKSHSRLTTNRDQPRPSASVSRAGARHSSTSTRCKRRDQPRC
jgi:hypothetical protein